MKSRLGGQRRHWNVTTVVKVSPFACKKDTGEKSIKLNCSQTLVIPVMTLNIPKLVPTATCGWPTRRRTKHRKWSSPQKTEKIWIFKVTSGLEHMQPHSSCNQVGLKSSLTVMTSREQAKYDWNTEETMTDFAYPKQGVNINITPSDIYIFC